MLGRTDDRGFHFAPLKVNESVPEFILGRKIIVETPRGRPTNREQLLEPSRLKPLVVNQLEHGAQNVFTGAFEIDHGLSASMK